MLAEVWRAVHKTSFLSSQVLFHNEFLSILPAQEVPIRSPRHPGRCGPSPQTDEMMEIKFTVGVGTALSGTVGHVAEKRQGYNEQERGLSCLERPDLCRQWFPAAPQPGLIEQGAVTFVG